MPRYGYEFDPRLHRHPGPPHGARHRMGVHDFGEAYGRYSGGPSYAYEYSERTILHPHGPERHGHGFSHPIRPSEIERPRRRPAGRERTARRARAPSGRRAGRRRLPRGPAAYDDGFRRYGGRPLPRGIDRGYAQAYRRPPTHWRYGPEFR